MQNSDQLRFINNFEYLIHYLEEKLDWPLQEYGFDELTFEYQPAELGLKEEDAAKVKNIYQLRPLQSSQPWGIFFVEFENKKLPVVVLRRILSHLVIKKRASANKAREAAWHAEDLMFITTFGEDDSTQREIAFAHFHQSPGDLPTLHVLGWDGGDTPLKLAHVDHQLHQYLAWPDDPSNINDWREQWSKPFRHRIGHVIHTADALAEVLAALARGIRDKAMKMISVESPDGPLRQLHNAFQTALIHDLTEANFADTYAQTITYGLLTAAISRTEGSEGRHGTFIIAENVTDMVPITNPFLREMLQTFLKVGGRKGGIDFDELGIQDVVELLRGDETDLPAILRDFGNKTQGEDPVIHFYEHFLSAYNRQLKIQRGVFYTPQPVVSYIIRSVHELLQTEFGLEDGLASTVTWGEMIKLHPDIRLPVLTPRNPAKSESKDILISPDAPFVMILDIATGTGTFLVEVIDVISKTMKVKWQKQGKSESEIGKLWNEYVPKHLLPRLYGYELMMAPYAIAHMKIGLKLFETGYRFESDERVRIYLTNTLEPPSDTQQQLAGILPALAHEAQAVNEVKKFTRFTIVVGNPPYAGHSSNNGEWILHLVRDYYFIDGSPLNERNPKWLQDDYVKFIRLGQYVIIQTGIGIHSFITNHGYIDNPTFRGMRQQLLQSFNSIDILDLHGNSTKKESCPDGSEDKNVFDIKQGVAIFSARRFLKSDKLTTEVRHAHLFGLRAIKYNELLNSTFSNRNLNRVSPSSPFYLFVPQENNVKLEYEQYQSITKIMPVNVLGFQTHRDHFAIDIDRGELENRIAKFRDERLSDVKIKEAFYLADTDGWNVHNARENIRQIIHWKKSIIICAYRLFDERYCYFNSFVMDRPRRELLDHVAGKVNLCLGLGRQGIAVQDSIWSLAWVSKYPVDANIFRRGGINIFPLYLYPVSGSLEFHDDIQLNFSQDFLKILSKKLGLKQKSGNGCPIGISPESIVHYAYAIYYSINYRCRYAEFLKIDFPRLPLTSNLQLFTELARLGKELSEIHLMESLKLNKFITKFIGPVGSSVEKITFSKNIVWINKGKTIGFSGVPEYIWSISIGGFQVCEKWLKDRKGRTLSDEDIKHYQRIVVALSETIRIMTEIDKVINEYGGWPGAFHTGDAATMDYNLSLNKIVELNKSTPKIQQEYDEAKQPFLSIVADAVTNSNLNHEKSDNEEAKTEPRRTYEIPDREDLICLVRQVFNDGIERERDAAITDMARVLGYQRTSCRIADELDDVLRTAVRRGIAENTEGMLRIAAYSIEQYDRGFLKDQFVSSLGGKQWVDRDEAIRGFARWLGFQRTGNKIDETARSLINGLIREDRIESNGTNIRRKIT